MYDVYRVSKAFFFVFVSLIERKSLITVRRMILNSYEEVVNCCVGDPIIWGIPYRPEYKVTPYFSNEKTRKNNKIFDKRSKTYTVKK
jgi:hypothetical protein